MKSTAIRYIRDFIIESSFLQIGFESFFWLILSSLFQFVFVCIDFLIFSLICTQFAQQHSNHKQKNKQPTWQLNN